MDPDTLITGAQAARLAGVSKQLIYRWRQLGHLHPAHVQDARPLFKVRDVWHAEKTTRRSPRSHRAEE